MKMERQDKLRGQKRKGEERGKSVNCRGSLFSLFFFKFFALNFWLRDQKGKGEGRGKFLNCRGSLFLFSPLCSLLLYFG